MRPGFALPIALLLAIPLAGCASDDTEHFIEDNGRDPELRGIGEYWLVWAHGEETFHGGEHPGGVLPGFDHTLVAADRTFTTRHAVDASTVRSAVAYDYVTSGGMAIVHEHVFNAPESSRRFGAYGVVTIVTHEDGTLVVDGTEVPQGKRFVLTYERKGDPGKGYEGRLEVENLGAWPTSGIEQQRYR